MQSAANKHNSRIKTLFLLLVAIGMIACGDVDKIEISKVMDARDQAISNRNIAEYSALISTSYRDHERGKVDVVAHMIALFDKFERAEMHSHDRHIRRLNETQVQCEQSYTLKVFAGGQWRQIVQREQLILTKEAAGWKISSGL